MADLVRQKNVSVALNAVTKNSNPRWQDHCR
jgi:hypothetical protein